MSIRAKKGTEVTKIVGAVGEVETSPAGNLEKPIARASLALSSLGAISAPLATVNRGPLDLR